MEEFDFDGKCDFNGMEEFDFDGKLDFGEMNQNDEENKIEPIGESEISQEPDRDTNVDNIDDQSSNLEQENESYENLSSESTSTVLIGENIEEGLQNDDQEHENIEEINQEELDKEIEKELEEGVEAINQYLEQETEFINAYQKMVTEAREQDGERESEGQDPLKTEEEWEKEIETAAYVAEQLYEGMNEIETDSNKEEVSELSQEPEIEKEIHTDQDNFKEAVSEQEEKYEAGMNEIEQHQVDPLIKEALETEPEPMINEKEIEQLQELDIEEQFNEVHEKEEMEELIEWHGEQIEQEKEEEVETQTDNSEVIISELEDDFEEGMNEIEQHQVDPLIEEVLETNPDPIVNERELEKIQEMELEEQFQTIEFNDLIKDLAEQQEEDKIEQEKKDIEQTQEIIPQTTYLQEKLEEQEQELEMEYEEKEEVERHQIEAAIEEELETEPKPIIREEELEYVKNFEPEKQLEAELFYELIEKLKHKENEEKEEHEELSTEEKVAQIKRELGINQEIKSGDAEVENRQEEVLEHETISPDVSEQSKKIEQEVLSEIDSEEEDSDQTAEKNYEKLKKLYKQQTGKRPIYANQETKGFKQWLEQKKEAEKQENMKHEQVLKEEQKNEEAWKRTLKNRIEEAREIEPELKSKLIKFVEKYSELEKLIKKYSQLHSKAQRKKLSQTERNELNSLVEELLKLDPINMELFLALQEIKRYINQDDYYYYEYWNNQRHNKVFNYFFSQLSQRYNNLKEIQKAKIVEELLENWIEEPFEAENNLELITVLSKIVENYDELQELTTNFMKLYEKAKTEKLIKSEQIEFKSLIKTLQKLDPLIIELFTNVRAIKQYLNNQNHDELLNKTRINRLLNIYLKQISQKYENRKQEMLKLKELIRLDTEMILMNQTSKPDEYVKIILNKNGLALKGYNYVRNEILREHNDEIIYSKILQYAEIVLKKQIKLGKIPLYKTAQVRLTTQQKLVDVYEGKDYVSENDKFYEFVKRNRDYEALVYLIKCKNDFPVNWFKGKKYFGYTHSTEKIRFRNHIREAIDQYMDYHNGLRSNEPTKLNRAICFALDELGYRINEISFLFEIEDVYSQIKFLEKLANDLEENYFDVINLAFHKKLKTALKHEIHLIAKHKSTSELNERGGGEGGQHFIALPLYDIAGMIALGCTQEQIRKIINQLYKDDFNREKIGLNTLRRRIIEEFKGWVNAQRVFLKPIVEALIYDGFEEKKIYNTLSSPHLKEGWLFAWWKNGESLDFKSWSELDKSKIKEILTNSNEKYCGIPKSKWEEWAIKEVPNYEIAKVTKLRFDTIVSIYKNIFGGRNRILFKYRRETTIKMREAGMSLKEIYTSIFKKTYYPSNFKRDFITWFDGMTPKQIEEKWRPNND